MNADKDRLLTWKEKIVAAMTGRNSAGMPLWYTHGMICKLISEAQGWNVKDKYKHGIATYLNALTKSGHLERAKLPAHMTMKVVYNGHEFLYRRTEKPYTRGYVRLQSSKNMLTDSHIRGQEAFELWRRYPTLPKWFRRMMMD